MSLTWRPSRFNGDVTATGCRGVYTVSPDVGYGYKLHGKGHDGLGMLALPPGGERFDSSSQARGWADRLDAVRHLESQVSGC